MHQDYCTLNNIKINKIMNTLDLKILRTSDNGRTTVGNIVAYYERHIDTGTGKMDFLHVSFLKSEIRQVPLSDGTLTDERQETPLHVDIEYSSQNFRAQILEQDNIQQFWDIFWQLYNQLKTE